MPSAVQLPIDRTPAVQVGPRTFRKRILREGTIPYEGRELTYTRDDLARYAENFKAGAYEQVPLMLVDGENRHSNDPERYRGAVKSMELTAEGLDAVVELTEDGAKVVRDNPQLGVSPRIVDEAEHVPHVPAIQHVALTLDPRVRDLGPWVAADLSGNVGAAVVDLTASDFMADTNTQPQVDPQPLSTEELAQFRTLAERASATAPKDENPRPPDAPPADPEPGEQRSLLSRLLGRDKDSTDAPEITDEQLADLLQTPESENREPAATLSTTDRQAVELAASRAETAESQAAAANAALRESSVAAERERRINAGVPPAIVDLAVPLLSAPTATVELSGGQSTDPREIVRKMLDEVEGIIKMTNLSGTVAVEEDAERKALLDAWAAASG